MAERPWREALQNLERQAFAPVLLRAVAPGANWQQRVLGAEVLRRCRGFAHQRVLTTQSFADAMDPQTYRSIEEAIRNRTRACDDLLSFSEARLEAMAVQLDEALTSAGSPLRPPALRLADGTPVPAEQLAGAKRRMRQVLAEFGAPALLWLRDDLLALQAVEPLAADGLIGLRTLPLEWIDLAMELAECHLGADCSPGGAAATERCLSSGRCGYDGDGPLSSQWQDAQQRHEVTALALQLAMVLQQGDWQRLGL